LHLTGITHPLNALFIPFLVAGVWVRTEGAGFSGPAPSFISPERQLTLPFNNLQSAIPVIPQIEMGLILYFHPRFGLLTSYPHCSNTQQ
jgi:hypothetical protein